MQSSDWPSDSIPLHQNPTTVKRQQLVQAKTTQLKCVTNKSASSAIKLSLNHGHQHYNRLCPILICFQAITNFPSGVCDISEDSNLLKCWSIINTDINLRSPTKAAKFQEYHCCRQFQTSLSWLLMSFCQCHDLTFTCQCSLFLSRRCSNKDVWCWLSISFIH